MNSAMTTWHQMGNEKIEIAGASGTNLAGGPKVDLFGTMVLHSMSR